MIGLNKIDDVVLAMMMDAHRRTVFLPLMRHVRILSDEAYNVAQALLIAVGLLPPEIQEAIEIAIDDVVIGLAGKSNVH